MVTHPPSSPSLILPRFTFHHPPPPPFIRNSPLSTPITHPCIASLSSMYTISSDGLPINVTYGLDPVNLPVQLHLVTFHHLLYGFTHIAQTHINTSLLDTYVGMGAHIRVRGILIQTHVNTSLPDTYVGMGAHVRVREILIQTHVNTSLLDTYVGMGAHVRVRGILIQTYVNTSLPDTSYLSRPQYYCEWNLAFLWVRLAMSWVRLTRTKRKLL